MAKNILIATPHSDFGELLQLTLEENSEYHISLVDSGHLLMESANKNPFDLVILDTAINDKPIIPLAQNFQDENPQAKLVIVMPQNEANLPDLSDIQVHGFLSRPCYPSDLLKMVDDLLGHSESSEKSVNNGQKIREESSLNKEELLVSGAPLTVEDARKNIPLENGAATPGNPPIIELPPAIQPVGDSSTLINNQGETTIVGGNESVDSSDILLDQQAKDLVAEAVAPKADFSLDEEEFSRELAALTATFNQSKQKTSPPIEKVNAVAIDNPFHETPDLEPVTGESSADDSEMVSPSLENSTDDSEMISSSLESSADDSNLVSPSLEISADDSNLVSPSLESSADDLVMVSIPHEDHSPEETDLETNPILKTVEAEIINLENELIAARSTWDEIVTTEKPSIDYGRSPEGDKELAEKHTGLSARYAALAKEYLGLSEEHTVLAGEHARMAEKKNILTKQRDEKEELVGNILELLKRAISGTDVQATLVIKGLNILGYAGESSEQALLELATFLERDWDKDGKGDLVRFVHLESIDLEYLVYSTVIKNEFILGMAYDTAIPLSKMRITSTKIAKELAVPDMVNILQELARKQEETASPKVTSWSELPIGIQSEDDNLSDNSAIELGSINNDLGTQSVTLQGNQSLERHSYDTGLDETKVEVENVDPSQVSISVPEEIEEILPIISAEQGIQETPIAFELSLEDEITNLLNQEEAVQNSETKPVTDGDLNRKSFFLTPMDGNQEISSEDVDSKPGIIVEQMETDKNLDKEQIIDGTNGEGKIDGIVEEPQLINLETIEANFALSVKPPEQDDDADQILKNVMDQLNRQSTPENDTQEEDELPGWYQEISAANAIQGEPAFDPQANNKIVEHPGETGNVQPPSDSKPVSITTEIPSEIVREIFDQLDNEENQSETNKPEISIPAQEDESIGNLPEPKEELAPELIFEELMEDFRQNEDSLTPEAESPLEQSSEMPGVIVQPFSENLEQQSAITSAPENSVDPDDQAEVITPPSIQEFVYPWEEKSLEITTQPEDIPTQPVQIWKNENRIGNEKSDSEGQVQNGFGWEYEQQTPVQTQPTQPNQNFFEPPNFDQPDEYLHASKDSYDIENLEWNNAPIIADSSSPEDENTPPNPISVEGSHPDISWEVSPPYQSRSNARRSNKMSYTCILVPRTEEQPIDDDIAEEIGNVLQDTSGKLGWVLEKMQIQPDSLLWTVDVMPTVSPGNLVRIIRQRTSRKIFARIPKLKETIPGDDFWAPGFLVVSGSEPPPANSLNEFIQQTRRRQKLIRNLTS